MDDTQHTVHPPHLQHHFETPAQQFDSAKLGMWLFLATEILLFGGLFCAYAVYRGNHPEIFLWAHHLLDTKLGAINTVVLLTSSLTMAWAVRCAQLDQRKLLMLLLSLTLLGGLTFMGIKYVEYESKWKHGLLWGTQFEPDEHYLEEHFGGTPGHGVPETDSTRELPAEGTTHGAADLPRAQEQAPVSDEGEPTPAPRPEHSTIRPAPRGPQGRAVAVATDEHAAPRARPSNVHVFFGIYFLMTGLHGLHVLAGMVILGWLLVRTAKGHFGSRYFTPVDLGGLYWHLVDLIWIFLFPLLYLIH